MSRWFKIVAPLGVTAVLVAVLAFGAGSPSGKAAECIGSGSTMKGTTSSAVTYQFTHCSDPTLALSVALAWGNAKKDLALRVTEPNGTQHFADQSSSITEGYFQAPPVAEGTWTVEVINKSNGKVDFGLNIAFMPFSSN